MRKTRAKQAEAFTDALDELLAAVRKAEACALNVHAEDLRGAPASLPSFTQLMHDLTAWRDAVEDRSIELKRDAQKRFLLDGKPIDLDMLLRETHERHGLPEEVLEAVSELDVDETLQLRSEQGPGVGLFIERVR